MHNKRAPEFVVDQGLYYPTATNYGYICTGFESPGEWDDHSRVFGLDGQNVQYAGAQTENFPLLYYTPNYGYAESLYNPYNPYIPGAVVGVDGPFLGAQQYYTIPSYENPSSSPAYVPVVQSRSDLLTSNTTDPFIHSTTSTANRADGPGLKHSISSASSASVSTFLGPASNQTYSFPRLSDGNQTKTAASKRYTTGNVSSSCLLRPAANQILQGGGTRALEFVPRGKAFPSHSQLKVALPRSNGLSSFGSVMHAQPTANKLQTEHLCGRGLNDTKVSPDALTDQIRGPRVDKLKNQLTVKAYTITAGGDNAQGNIIISTDRYNKEDFQVEYTNAKFFVIKSYSEDDVHKSIKYNVWSSTPNGNQKLNSAYEAAQRIANGDPRGCPIFLFFSVNASGQFCGVAEMTGPVDFHKDMDFWQQDKWNGSFPVKWHIIQDVPNFNFRHIILENNDHKPVTNSRDTQEVSFKKGIEMLKLFKNYMSKTSLLDDFMYYENRQKILQVEKAKLLVKNYDYHFLHPVSDPPRKVTSVADFSKEDDNNPEYKDLNYSEHGIAPYIEAVCLDGNANKSTVANEDIVDVADVEASIDNVSRIGTLTITPKQSGSGLSEVVASTVAANSAPTDDVTVSSMQSKANGFAESPGFLTFGTIPVDTGALEHGKLGYRRKGGN
ncbi:hypothetical protein ACH5RR_033599 [Cinchona calisaya]|uniref:YTH domain-containing family protein n=1 Tax=Cinchona calisaya TaxID=153742 RepID=A0ABD2YQV2_9GENT